MSQPASPFLVVGIGASAGGVEALQAFFAHVAPHSGCAYIVILHLLPAHESQLATLLQAVAPIPVATVTEPVRVEPNHVYVVPPDQHLMMVDGEVHVSPNTLPEERRAPIDIFFRTLADSHDGRGVCVILSGSGADGSLGLKRVKERGGAVFVQSPREAAFAEMPRAAIATDLVDDVLPVADIPARVLAYQARIGSIAIPEEPEQRPEEQQQALREVFAQLRLRTSHDFSDYKRPTLLRRIARRITVRNLSDLPAYAAYLREHPDEVQALLKDLLISVTNFFRDPEAFAALEQEALPRLFQGRHTGDQVRIWVVGCATGEEAYSLAMLCAERTLDVLDAPSVQIFATDIDEAAIAHARAGLYTAADIADITPERLRRFFTKEDERYRVRNELRESVLFAAHNILKDPPFSHIDLVTCRNVLIYLNRSAQERVLEILHFALNPGGSLFLGTAESVDGASDLFALVSRPHRLFQHRPTGLRPLPLPEPGLGRPLHLPPTSTPGSLAALALASEQQARERISFEGLHQRLLEQYAPPSLVVTEGFEVMHVSEQAGRYLRIPPGVPSTNLLELVRPELRAELRTALYQALQHQTNVDAQALPVRIDDRPQLLTLRVRPVLRHDDPARGFLLVLFEEGAVPSTNTEEVIRSEEGRTRQLEDEVTRLRQQLRSSAEQYEYQTEEFRATNEELQALNEELRSSAEELHTSKEELQSINEELRTVNQELKVKVEEATQSSANLHNLVNSTAIATIFLDRSMRVRLFTPAARALFNLIAADHGRPLSDLTHRLLDVDVLALARMVLANLQPVEQEVRSSDGQVYVLRVLPYRMGEDRIGGVVLTFFDISERTRAEQMLREHQQRQQFLLTLSDALRPLADPIDIQATLTRTAMRQFHADRCYYCEIEDGNAIIRRDASREDLPSVVGVYPLGNLPILKAVIDVGGVFTVHDVHTTDLVDEPLRELCVQLQIISFLNVPVIKDGEPAGVLCITQGTPREWTDFEEELAVETAERAWAAVERARAEAAVRVSEEKYRSLFETMGQGYAECELVRDDAGRPLDHRLLELNPAFERLTGVSAQEARGRLAREVFPGLAFWWTETWDRVIQQGKPERIEHEEASLGRWYEVYVYPGPDDRFVQLYADITERKRAEAAIRASELRFRTLADAVPQLIWTNDADGNAAYFNQRWYDYSGLTYEQSAGPGWQAIVHRDDAPDAVERWQQALAAGEVFETEYRLRGADGVYRWFLGRNMPLRDEAGATIGWFGSATDIEALKQAEAARRESEERFRLLVEGARDYAMFLLDPENRITFWSAGAERVFGWSEAEALGQSGAIIFTPEDRVAGPMEDEMATAQAEGSALDRRWHLRKDERRIFLDGALIRLDDERGRPRGFVKIARDATAQRRAEDALQRAHDELEQRVEERTAALVASNQARQELLRQLVMAQEEERLRIARDLHDQLGQLITGLLLGLKQLEQRAADGPLAEMISPLQSLALDLAKEAHRLAVNLRPTVLDDVGLVPALELLVRSWSEQTQIQAAFLSQGFNHERLPPVLETTLYRAVQEALTNVGKHADARNVSVLLERRGDEVVAIVENDGQGFEPEAAPPDTERPRLGLRGMRERVGQVGGTLEIESSPDSGTTVFVRIPLEQPDTNSEAPFTGG